MPGTAHALQHLVRMTSSPEVPPYINSSIVSSCEVVKKIFNSGSTTLLQVLLPTCDACCERVRHLVFSEVHSLISVCFPSEAKTDLEC